MKSAIRLVLALGISALCVWLSMKDVPVREVLLSLRGANYAGFVAVMALTLLGFWVRAARWRWFIQSDRRLSGASLFSATMIGFMANNVLPFRIGEFVRPWVLARRERISKTTLLATIVVERIVDMLTLLTIFGVSQALHPIASASDAGRLVQLGARVLVIACVALIALFVAIERSRPLADAVTKLVTRPLPERLRARAQHMIEHFLLGLGLFRDVGKLLGVFALSFAMFLCFAFAISVSMWSLHLETPWYAGLVMLVITAIGIMVPAAPGGVGPLNYACTVGLALFGVAKGPAAGFGWFWFFSQWLPITVVGLFYLNREGLSLRSLGQAQGDER